MAPQETPTPKVDRIRDRILDFLEWMRQELTKLFQIGRIKYDTTSLSRERTALYQELGQKTAELMKQGQLNPEALSSLVERIDLLSKRIEECRTEIRTIVKKRNDEKISARQN